MAYKLIISERADDLIDNLTGYLLYRLNNTEAAVHFRHKTRRCKRWSSDSREEA